MIGKSAPPRQSKALVAIALFKLAKAAACVILATASFRLVNPAIAEHFAHWLAALTLTTRPVVVVRLIDWLLNLEPRQFRLFGAVAATYALLYAVQGIGLWRGKRWAQYLIVIETGLLLPLEVWELAHKFTVFKLGVLATNIVIVVFLIHVLRTPHAPAHRRDA
jgi:uncharacterized membrane protein (DUF2068 family)